MARLIFRLALACSLLSAVTATKSPCQGTDACSGVDLVGGSGSDADILLQARIRLDRDHVRKVTLDEDQYAETDTVTVDQQGMSRRKVNRQRRAPAAAASVAAAAAARAVAGMYNGTNGTFQFEDTATPFGYLSLGINTKCRGYEWEINDIENDMVWPKHHGAQTLKDCAEACDASLHKSGDCTAIEFDDSTNKCSLYSHPYVQPCWTYELFEHHEGVSEKTCEGKTTMHPQTEGPTCYTNGKAYKEESDVWGLNEDFDKKEKREERMWETWGTRMTPKRAPKFKQGDVIIFCGWTKAELLEMSSEKDHCHRDDNKDFWVQHGKVVEVLDDGKYTIDLQDGITGYEVHDFSVQSDKEAILDSC